MNYSTRSAIAVLVLSASGFVATMSDEKFVSKASIPTKNDVPTVCYGMTWRPDGTRVKLGDICTPEEGLKRSLAHIAKDEMGLKKCVTAPLTQNEYDILVDFAYQYGVPTACTSSVVKQANAGRYTESCNAYIKYKFSGEDKYDCSTLVNGKPNKRCWGVWTRNIARKDKCLKDSTL